jgi:FHA domain-containing protein
LQQASAEDPDDPFAGLMPAAAGLDPALGNVARSTSHGPAKLPDDFDIFAPAPAAAKPAAASAASASGNANDPFADLFADGSGGQAGAPSIDQAFNLGPAAPHDKALDRFAAEPASAAPGELYGADLSTDPLALFGEDGGSSGVRPRAGHAPSAPGPAAVSPPGPVAQPDHHPALHDAYTPPRVLAPAAPVRPLPAASVPPATIAAPPPPELSRPPRGTAVTAPPAASRLPAPAARPASSPRPAAPVVPPVVAAAAATPARAAPGDIGAQLWLAFCEGAGVDLPVPAGDPEARMRHIGRIVRSAVEGTLQLMAVRASTKHEMRAAVTQIRATNNNPLKFAPDATTGVEQLLSPPQRGFLDGANAMDDAMVDLVGHSIGTVAGMRAAIEGMLARFDPAALEEKLGAGSLLANLVPASRKARLWELYLQHHRQIRAEAEDDFHTVFGRAFVAAYEEQVDRLEAQRREQRRERQ